MWKHWQKIYDKNIVYYILCFHGETKDLFYWYKYIIKFLWLINFFRHTCLKPISYAILVCLRDIDIFITL